MVEISTTAKDELLVAAFDVASPESLLIHLMADKAQAVMAEFGGDHEQLAQYLRVINKRLVLLNPVSQLSNSASHEFL